MNKWNNNSMIVVETAQSTAAKDNTMIYVFTSIMLIGFFGNVKVIIDIFSISKKRRRNNRRCDFKLKNVTDIFIVNLAFADLSLTLVIPVLITKMVIGQWTLGLLPCKFYMTFDGVAKFVSVAFIVLLSFDRYLAVCHPLASRGIRTPNFGNVCSLCAWTVVVLLMMPVFIVTKLHFNSEAGDNETKIQCAIPSAEDSGYSNATNLSLNDIFMMYNFTLNYFLPLILILFFYIQILFILRKRHHKFHSKTMLGIASMEHSPKMPQRQYSSRRKGVARNKRMTLLILLIVLTYTFCWMPYWVLQFSIQFNAQAFFDLLGDEYFPLFSFAAYALQMTNSALNPYFYLASMYFRKRHTNNLSNLVSKAKVHGVNPYKENDTVTLASSV